MSDLIDPRLQALIKEAAADLARDFDPSRGRALVAAKRDDSAPIVGMPFWQFGRANGGSSFFKVAAPLTLVAALTIGFFAIKQIPSFTHAPTPGPQANTYSTTNGQRANVTLSDGSTVNLAPATTMRVVGRSIELKGEAVFTVTQHTNDPFTVKAGNTITRVLGTTFGVRAYDNTVRVAVQDGKISVNPTNVVGQGASLAARPRGAILSANDVVLVNNGQTSVTRNANVTNILAWTTGVLNFTNTTLGDAVPDLNRWYDAEVRIADPSLSHERFTAALPAGSRADLAEALEYTFKARVVQDGRRITLYRR